MCDIFAYHWAIFLQVYCRGGIHPSRNAEIKGQYQKTRKTINYSKIPHGNKNTLREG